MDKQLLGIYLNDHLAAAVAGTELARRVLHNNRQTRLRPDLERLVREIDEDRRTLEGLIQRLGISRSTIKTSSAWVAEKVARLKLNGRLLRYSPLSRVEELEALSIGVAGKQALWAVLKRLQSEGEDFGLDLDDLQSRAQRQRRLLERRRLETAAAAFEG